MKNCIKNITSRLSQINPAELIIRLVSMAVLYSHIIGYEQWFTVSAIFAPIMFPHIVYVIMFAVVCILCVITLIMPNKALWLIIGMVISTFFNIHIITPFWINYIFLLLFARFDTKLQLVVWLIGIQEIWAGLNKFNSGYGAIVNFFSSPFISTYGAMIIAGCVICIPVLEILTGLAVLLRKKYALYAAIVVHGGALIILIGFLQYGHNIWIWNLLIIIIIWILYYKNISASIHLSWKNLVIIILLAIIPLTQIFTTLTYPLSYRMYTGSESELMIDNESYAYNYYQKTGSTPFLSFIIFQSILKKRCRNSEFETAKITVPTFLARKEYTTSFLCNDHKLMIEKSYK